MNFQYFNRGFILIFLSLSGKNILYVMTRFFISFLSAVALGCGILSAQDIIVIHSTDDFRQVVPFYAGYMQDVSSFEADVRMDGKRLVIADDSGRTVEETYVKPIVRLFSDNGGKAYKDSEKLIQIVFDIKGQNADKTVRAIEELLSEYPEVFDPEENKYAALTLIAGNIPSPEHFSDYKDFIRFETGPDVRLSEDCADRVGVIGCNFRDLSSWTGKGSMKPEEEKLVMKAIADAHRAGKPIRFIGAPDNTTAWNRLNYLGADIICTEDLEGCTRFFADSNGQEFRLSSETRGDFVAKVKFLDKATQDFEGFNAAATNLSRPVPTYMPEYDFPDTAKVRNVILMIGDGMGIPQAYAAYTVNGALTMFNMDKTAFVKTNSKNRYTTDSAGAGSSIATGTQNSNGRISMSDDGVPYTSITEILTANGIPCGVVSLGNIVDATPAAFYAHASDRDAMYEITECLTDGHVTFVCGSDHRAFIERPDSVNLYDVLRSQYRITDCTDDIDLSGCKEICIDDRMGKFATEETLGYLAEITGKSLKKMDAASDSTGFFIMIEGAKIDYAGHAKFLPGSIMETLSFDLAIAEALRFADENGETLVIVTADHETGGLALVDGDLNEHYVAGRYMTEDHTPMMVPLFAYGPGAENFTGVYQNTEIFHKILKAIYGD